MTCVAAFGAAWTKFRRLKRVGRCVVIPLGISPPVGLWEALGVLLNERNVVQLVRDIHEVG